MLFIHNSGEPSEEFMLGLDAEEARLVKYFTPLVVDDSQLAFEFDEELVEYGILTMGIEIEEWRQIEAFPNYQVSNMGRVRSNRVRGSAVKTGDWYILKPVVMKSGYYAVRLSYNGKISTPYIHTLVLTAFVGPRPSKMDACHGNGIRTDNCLCNLRWDTRSENEKDKDKHGTRPVGEKCCLSKLSEEQVIEIKGLLAEGKLTRKAIGSLYGVTRTAIDRIALGKNWKHLLTAEERAAQVIEYVEGREDEEWHSRGGW